VGLSQEQNSFIFPKEDKRKFTATFKARAIKSPSLSHWSLSQCPPEVHTFFNFANKGAWTGVLLVVFTVLFMHFHFKKR
jgi:hypothetical protein